jgi:hypothetical protein
MSHRNLSPPNEQVPALATAEQAGTLSPLTTSEVVTLAGKEAKPCKHY